MAEIRIASPYMNFNITGSASFENIEFTGEDLFAKATLNGVEMGYAGDLGMLAFLPIKKCLI